MATTIEKLVENVLRDPSSFPSGWIKHGYETYGNIAEVNLFEKADLLHIAAHIKDMALDNGKTEDEIADSLLEANHMWVVMHTKVTGLSTAFYEDLAPFINRYFDFKSSDDEADDENTEELIGEGAKTPDIIEDEKDRTDDDRAEDPDFELYAKDPKDSGNKRTTARVGARANLDSAGSSTGRTVEVKRGRGGVKRTAGKIVETNKTKRRRLEDDLDYNSEDDEQEIPEDLSTDAFTVEWRKKLQVKAETLLPEVGLPTMLVEAMVEIAKAAKITK